MSGSSRSWCAVAVAVRATVVVVALCTIVASASAADAPSTSLEVRGNVAQPATYAPSSLSALPQHDVSVPAPDSHARLYRGVLLRDLVGAAKPVENGRFDLRQSIVVAHATDGYLAIFSWAELFNSPIADEVLVASSLDGAPLSDGEGAFALVSGRDTKPAPRHVRWLQSIELRRVTP